MPFNSPLPSPMALNKEKQSPSIFRKRSANPVLPASAASYLSALSQADARARGATPTTTPALSLSSSITSSSEDTVLHEEDEYTSTSNADGLLLPVRPPTSEQVFTTVHTEFGHCANEEYRTTSAHPAGTPLPAHVEQDPPYYILLSTYISYLILIVLGHVRDFIGKKLSPGSYKHLMPRDVSVIFVVVMPRTAEGGAGQHGTVMFRERGTIGEISAPILKLILIRFCGRLQVRSPPRTGAESVSDFPNSRTVL